MLHHQNDKLKQQNQINENTRLKEDRNRLRSNIKLCSQRKGREIKQRRQHQIAGIIQTPTPILPFKQQSDKSREADILPWLKIPLVVVNKMFNKRYITIFHPGEEGVNIHKSARAADPTILMALCAIAMGQTKPKVDTMQKL